MISSDILGKTILGGPRASPWEDVFVEIFSLLKTSANATVFLFPICCDLEGISHPSLESVWLFILTFLDLGTFALGDTIFGADIPFFLPNFLFSPESSSDSLDVSSRRLFLSLRLDEPDADTSFGIVFCFLERLG